MTGIGTFDQPIEKMSDFPRLVRHFTVFSWRLALTMERPYQKTRSES
jgi:hypothetical protein